MFKNHLLITLRSMMKNKFFISINVLGMGIAIACCIVAYQVYQYDSNFDRSHVNGETIYRISAVREFEKNFTKFGLVPKPMGQVVKENNEDVKRVTRYCYSWSNFKRDDDVFDARLSYVDPDFFEMFTFQFVVGDGRSLKDKTTIVVSEPLAIRLFGSAYDAFGKTITQVYGVETREVKIGGVFKEQPQNSSFYSRESYMHIDNHKEEFKDAWDENWQTEATVFVQIEDAGRVSAVSNQIQEFKKYNNDARKDFQVSKFVLDPYVTMGHEDRKDDVRTATWDAPPVAAAIGSAIMGVFILLIACFNLTNTAIAISSRRLKEIGIRKVMGSMRQQLIVQFIGETAMICILGFIAGVLISYLLIDGWNVMWQYMRIDATFLSDPVFIVFTVGILLFTALLAGCYPAFYISKFEPISILKGKLKFGGTNIFTRVLLGAQFTISLMAIISAIGFYQNARFQENYDLGFSGRNNIVAWLNDGKEVQALATAIESHPEIINVAGASSGIFSGLHHDPIKHNSKQIEVDIIDVGDKYLEAMDMKITQGRGFLKDSESDRRESVIISQRLADLYGWEKPLGKEIIWKDSAHYFVIGVVKDIYMRGLWQEIQPLMIRYIDEDKYTQLIVSANAGTAAEVHKFIEEKWKGIFQNRLYNGRMFSMELQEMIDVNENILKMYAFLGIVALWLSATGLFTLVSLNIIKRMKEIGVRKVLGASIGNIARIINVEFVIILSIAALLGSITGYFATDALMSTIWTYYQAATASTFIVAVALMVLISALAIGYKVYKAADMNPVNTLRDE